MNERTTKQTNKYANEETDGRILFLIFINTTLQVTFSSNNMDYLQTNKY